MKKIHQLILLVSGSFLFVSPSVLHATVPNNDFPNTFLGPMISARLSSPLTYFTAYSFAGEAGFKNFRIGGTFAWQLETNQRVKLSADYLWQDLTFSFFSGNTNQWVRQGSLALDYQYLVLNNDYEPQVDLEAYLSRAPSRSLSTRIGSYMNNAGTIQPFTNNRHIAGADGAGVAPGINIKPWQDGVVGMALHYDNIRYNADFVNNRDAKGIGASVHFSQVLIPDVILNAEAAYRKPFNHYQINFNFTDIPYLGRWILGLGAAYTVGKNSLPNTYNVGLSADYALDDQEKPLPRKLKGELSDKIPLAQHAKDDFISWTKEPAINLPQVLAVADGSV